MATDMGPILATAAFRADSDCATLTYLVQVAPTADDLNLHSPSCIIVRKHIVDCRVHKEIHMDIHKKCYAEVIYEN